MQGVNLADSGGKDGGVGAGARVDIHEKGTSCFKAAGRDYKHINFKKEVAMTDWSVTFLKKHFKPFNKRL